MKGNKRYKINMLKSSKRNYIDILELRNFLLELATTTKLIDQVNTAIMISILDSLNETYEINYLDNEALDTVSFNLVKLIKIIKQTIKGNQEGVYVSLDYDDNDLNLNPKIIIKEPTELIKANVENKELKTEAKKEGNLEVKPKRTRKKEMQETTNQ